MKPNNFMVRWLFDNSYATKASELLSNPSVSKMYVMDSYLIGPMLGPMPPNPIHYIMSKKKNHALILRAKMMITGYVPHMYICNIWSKKNA